MQARLLLLLLALLLTACAGEITGPDRASTVDGSDDGNADGGDQFVVPDGLGDQFMIPSDPGTRSLARLNNEEYNNTLADLLGIPSRPADDFPADDRGYGFDNIADVLSTSPLLVEMYERTATDVAYEVMFDDFVTAENWHVEAEMATTTTGSAYSDVGWNLYSNGSATTIIDAPADGTYRITARAFGQQAGPEIVQMAIVVDGSPRATVAVAAENNFEVYVVETQISAGPREVGVAFTNDYYDQATSSDRNLIVDSFTIDGPLDAMTGETNPMRERLITCDLPAEGRACARTVLEDFAGRAWRRPVTSDEVDGLMAFIDLAELEGDDVDMGIELALRAILLSPNFIFKVEIDEQPDEPIIHALNDYELATRLSYFLWSSTPDDELLNLASQGNLQDDGVLTQQISRMLQDPRAEALVSNFGGQWLFIRAIDEAQPDVWYFPDWNDQLRADMRTEAEMFFRSITQGERSMMELLTGEETYVNATLADHYGLSGTFDENFVETSIAGTGRTGFVTQGALLTSTSYATRTSPVRRGEWVLSHLLCRKPPPPPAGVEGIPQENPTGATLRERLEIHRADPVCASCHDEMDAIGFAMENFDGIGAWRDTDEGFPVDASGELNATMFDGATDLAAIIANDPDFASCTTENAFVYAIGRGPTTDDGPYHDDVAAQFVDGGFMFQDLVTEIALSEPFRLRRGRTPE